MGAAPLYEIDPAGFHADPYPDYAAMQALGPLVRVPQLNATLITHRDVIFAQEKRIEVLSSRQPQGLMTRLMGENMMRKDGAAHAAERAACFPAFSPRTVAQHWRARFDAAAEAALDALAPRGGCDLVRDYAMRVSGEALRAITGLETLGWQDMDRVSQAMIDGIANYAGVPEVEARCRAAVAEIDAAIEAQWDNAPPLSLLAVQQAAGLPRGSIGANIRLAISGGQNEPRDAIAGCAWAVLTHPQARAALAGGHADWRAAFEEYARWIAPIGMSPREIARADTLEGVTVRPGERVFLMFGAGNRDPRVFDAPERFDITRDTRASLSFGAGPHFCAGAAAARILIAEVALPRLFDRFPALEMDGDAPFAGWAFRGPTACPVRW